MYKPFGRVYEDADEISAPAFRQAVREIYKSVYSNPEPEKDQLFKQLVESLKDRKAVTLKRRDEDRQGADP